MSSPARLPGNEKLAFKLLGPLEFFTPSGESRTLSGRLGTTLSALLIRANQVVSVEHLVDSIWDENPPNTFRAQVQFCIHTLRAIFDRDRMPARIITQPMGYALEMPAELLDSQCFEHYIGQARTLAGSDSTEAVALFRNALALWRGRPLDGAPRIIRDQAAWLEELRIAALEECVALELELGRHRDVLGELRLLVAENPLNEQFRYLLMLALHRSGRQSGALEVYRAGRAELVEELGLEPGEKLRQLEAAILADDPRLYQVVSTGEPVIPAEPVWARPRQLPAAIADFTGREDVVALLESYLANRGRPGNEGKAVSVVNVTGMAGVGKSVLAVHVAHQVSDTSFPDGQLYVNLGATQAEPPTTHEVLGRFLRALGVSGRSLPSTVAERAELYRSLLAGRKVLVVLEDAVNEAQVPLLLPGSSSCAVVITSRTRLTGLPGALVLNVDVFDRQHAMSFLAQLVGVVRLRREPAEAEKLLDAVGDLPLAVRIVGARLAARPHWSLRSMLNRLIDETCRLDELAHGDLVVRGSLSLTYDSLDPEAATLLARLGVVDCESLPSWTALAVLEGREPKALDLLDRLVDVQLLDTVVAQDRMIPRYRFHDLIRIFARERLRHDEPTTEQAVLGRVMSGWLTMAELAHRRLYGGDFTTLHGDAPRWRIPTEVADEIGDDPLRWLETERANICAAIAQGADAGLNELCWDLAVTMVSLFEARGYFDDWLHTHQHALRATRAAGNLRGTAAMQCSLGSLYLNQCRLDLARSMLTPALETFRELGEPRGLALAHRNLGLLERLAGAHGSALAHCRQGLDRFAEVEDVVGQAAVLSQMAQIELDRSNPERASRLLERATELLCPIDGPRIQAQIRYKHGKILIAKHDYPAASRMMGEVLDLVQASGDQQGEGYTLHSLGVIRMHQGELTAAAELLQKAAALCEQNLDHVGVARVRLDLARIASQRGQNDDARLLAEHALDVFAKCGTQRWVEETNAFLAAGACRS